MGTTFFLTDLDVTPKSLHQMKWPYDQWKLVLHIYLPIYDTNQLTAGKYASPIDPMGSRFEAHTRSHKQQLFKALLRENTEKAGEGGEIMMSPRWH